MFRSAMTLATILALAGCDERPREERQAGNRPSEASPDSRGQNMGQAGRDDPGTAGLQQDQARSGTGPTVQGRRPPPDGGGASGNVTDGGAAPGSPGAGGQAGSTGR
jgi:hypothetical protein